MKKISILVLAVLIAIAAGSIVYAVYQSGSLEKTKGKLQEVQKDLVDAKIQHYQHDLIPPNYVLAQGLNANLIKKTTERATFPIIYSIGESHVRLGRVVILGKETLGNKDYYVGFTTSCAVTLNHPWPVDIKEEEKYSEIIAIKPPGSGYDYYLKGGSKLKDKGIALARIIPELKQDLSPLRLSAKGKNWKGFANIPQGAFIKVRAEDEWQVGPGWKKCGAKGLTRKDESLTLVDYRLHSKHPLGCLLIALGDEKGELYKYYGPEDKEFEQGFYLPEKSNLYFAINDTCQYDNTGKITIRVTCFGLTQAFQEFLQTSDDRVMIKTFGRNDVALVYFPVSPHNFFGSRKPDRIPSLGLTKPTELVTEIINKSTHHFGFNFFLYCESCDAEISKVPEKIREIEKEWAKIARESYERGKKEGVTIFVAGLLRPVMGLVSGIVDSLILDLGLPESMCNIASPMLTRLTTTMLFDPLWEKDIKPSLESLLPEARGYLPERLSDIEDLVPQKVRYEDIEKVLQDTLSLKDGSKINLAGILPSKDRESDLEAFLKNLLESATSLILVPHTMEGKKSSAHLIADNRYVNQVLVLEGLAKPEPKDKKFPFREEFLRDARLSEQRKK